MTRRSIIDYLSLLLVLLTGCTGFRPATLPDQYDLHHDSSDDTVIAAGALVRIRHASGNHTSGRILEISNETILLLRSGNYGYEEVLIGYSDIASIEVKHNTAIGEAAPLALMGLGLGAAILAIGISKGLSDLK